MNDQPRMVKAAEMLELTAQKTGKRYFSGYAGPIQYLLFDTGKTKELKSRPGEAVPVWRLMIQEADPDRRPQSRQDERPSSGRPIGRAHGCVALRGAQRAAGTRTGCTALGSRPQRLVRRSRAA
jgi:hypothetical protein